MRIGTGFGLIQSAVSTPVFGIDPDQTIRDLFGPTDVGAWYDPSDSTTVFQDAAGTTPAGVGDPVGLILDKSQGLTLGAELTTNGTFDTATNWTLGTGWSISGGKADAVSVGSAAYLQQPLTPSPGYYKITFDVVSYTSGNLKVFFGGVFTGTVASGTGSYSAIIYSTGAGTSVRFSASTANFTGSIDNVSVRELPGNHATQSTSAARPVLQQSGGLYYLDFDGVDDWMGDVVFSSPIPVPMTYSIAARWSGNGSVPTNEYLLDSTMSNRHAIYKNNSNVINVFVGTNVSLSPATTLGADELLTIDVQGPSISSIRRNGAVAQSGLSLNASLSQFRLANYFGGSGTGGYYLDGRIYGMVLTSRTLTAAEITDLETYLAAKSGVTL